MNVLRSESQVVALKVLQNNSKLSKERRFQIGLSLAQVKAKSSRVRVRNRCVLTGRPRGVYNYFKISRIMVKELASQALLPGLKRATW